jgi:LytS/YehU family sensor histidine kinase
VDPILNTKDKLPSMLLQPIVENAVNHGVFNKDIPGTVIIKFKKLSKQHILIHVIDDGIGYTINKQDKRYKSSTVLDDRIKYLNDSGLWDITVTRGAVTTDKEYPGHEVIFDIKKMKNENL